MLLILPPVNGTGIPVHRADDVDGALRTIIALCPPAAILTLWWYEDGSPMSRLILGVNGPDRAAALRYCGGDGEVWIPSERGGDELHFSDGHQQVDFEGAVGEDAAVAAAVAFVADAGARPATLAWEEEWRAWDDDGEYARTAERLIPEIPPREDHDARF